MKNDLEQITITYAQSKCDHPCVKFSIAALEKALRELPDDAFKLWVYIASQNPANREE